MVMVTLLNRVNAEGFHNAFIVRVLYTIAFIMKMHMLLEEPINHCGTPDIGREREIYDCFSWRDYIGFLVDYLTGVSERAKPVNCIYRYSCYSQKNNVSF